MQQVIPPLNCKITMKGSKGRNKVVHEKVSDAAVYRVMLVDDTLLEFAPPTLPQAESIQLNPQQQQILDDTLASFKQVFSAFPGRTELVTDSISLTDSTPQWTPSYSVPMAYRDEFKKEIDTLLQLGIIELSQSAWSSSPIPVKKKDNGIRLVVDFRKLNTVTVPEPFQMPTIQAIIAKLGSAAVLSKLDLVKGFHQVPMDNKSKEYTAFSCAYRKFQNRLMPFGLRSAPATFQLLMQRVLAGLEDYSVPYIDDIIIFSTSIEFHIDHIKQVLGRLAQHGLTVKESKCKWCFTCLEFLGHMIGRGKMSIPQARVDAMAKYKMANYYAKYVPSFALHSSVLSPAIRKGQPSKIAWTPEMITAFKDIIQKICQHTQLVVPEHTDELCIFTDTVILYSSGDNY